MTGEYSAADSGKDELIGVDLTGQILGRAYRVVREIDTGGMGTVYEAEHVRLHRRLAVKVMAAHLASDENALVRFHREAEIISQLDHPHIVQVIDFDTTDDGQPYLVMEYLRGESLETRLQRARPLPLHEALQIAIQAALGLAAAHRTEIIHRDLKPGNIFLVNAGDRAFVKLLDFGISKRTGHGHKKGLTGEFDILGTPDYMAPEQALGKTAFVDHRGDQFALAVITFEMLTGGVPFAADEVMEVLQRVIRDTPVAPSAMNPAIPAEVDAVILRALSKDPDDRYSSISAFAQALEEAGFDALVAASERPSGNRSISESAVSSLVPPPPSRRWLSSTNAGQAPTASGPDLSQSPHHPSEPPRQEPPQQRDRTSTSSWRAKDPAVVVEDMIDRARQELGLDNLDVALSYAESAMKIARDQAGKPAQLVQANAPLFDAIFERHLGSSRMNVDVSAPPMAESGISPEEAFLLSRMEGGMTVEEAVDLSPLRRTETLFLLLGLLRSGHLSTERTA